MKRTTVRTVRAVAARLEKQYGPKVNSPSGRPLDGLVVTILSQNTNDTNRDRAYRNLRSRFPSWESLVQAPVSEVAECLRVGGLARQKAARIQALLRSVKEETGKLSLNFLKERSDQQVSDFLSRFKGVGPKTVACVLLFSLGRDAFPVDTHVHRVTRRLGWIDAKVSAEAAHGILSSLIPPEVRYSLHLNLIAHGRDTCHPRSPGCERCVLLDLCPHGQEQS